MNLEDHAGDVVRKARQMAGMDASAVALRLGWEADRLARFEDSGDPGGPVKFDELARSLDLSGGRLQALCAGWLPPLPDLSLWPGFRRFTTSGGGMSVHCYLVWDSTTREAALFDAGFDANEPLAFVAASDLRLRHLCITHSHHDHVGGLEAVRKRHPQVQLHANATGAPATVRVRPGEIFACGGLSIAVRETPGHAADGVTYVVSAFEGAAPALAVVGDAIFAGSMGGAKEHGLLARRKVVEEILSLPPDTLVCPGHGPFTTVGMERENNPFFPLDNSAS